MLKYSAIVNLSVSALKCYGLGSSLQRLKCVPVVYSLTKRNYIVRERFQRNLGGVLDRIVHRYRMCDRRPERIGLRVDEGECN